ncbi:MAG: response regulator, partial [Kiloniellales bacterium]|nr:response regulator [Kiloniellales bacterium]
MTANTDAEKSGGEHIVIVDDEPDVRDTLGEYLGLQGFRVTTLEDGKALRRLVEEEEPFVLAILDITMPGEDGLSLARFLKESSDVGIIMVTASGETVDRIVGLEMGADDYLPKPVDLRELLARVKAVLRRRRAAPGASSGQGAAEQNLVQFGRCQ